MKDNGQNSNKIVVLPKYKFDERLQIDREIHLPPASLFQELGFNENKDAGKKHYRRYFPDELEEVSSIMPRKPFYEEKIYRG